MVEQSKHILPKKNGWSSKGAISAIHEGLSLLDMQRCLLVMKDTMNLMLGWVDKGLGLEVEIPGFDHVKFGFDGPAILRDSSSPWVIKVS